MATGRIPINGTAAIQSTIVDAKGDLIVGTGADAVSRLAVGTDTYTLVADSSAATGLKWAAPAGGSGLTLVQRSTFTNVANTSTTFDGVFTSTYKAYLIQFEGIGAATVSDDLIMLARYGAVSETANYYCSNAKVPVNSVALVNVGSSAAASGKLTDYMGDNTDGTTGYLFAYKVGNASEYAAFQGNLLVRSTADQYLVALSVLTARTYTGFQLKSSSTNITGTVAVYGLATA